MEVATDSLLTWKINLKVLENSHNVDCGPVLQKLVAVGRQFH